MSNKSSNEIQFESIAIVFQFQYWNIRVLSQEDQCFILAGVNELLDAFDVQFFHQNFQFFCRIENDELSLNSNQKQQL